MGNSGQHIIIIIIIILLKFIFNRLHMLNYHLLSTQWATVVNTLSLSLSLFY